MELLDPVIRIKMNNGDIFAVRIFSIGSMTMEHRRDDYAKFNLELYVEDVRIIKDYDKESDPKLGRKLMMVGGKKDGK